MKMGYKVAAFRMPCPIMDDPRVSEVDGYRAKDFSMLGKLKYRIIEMLA